MFDNLMLEVNYLRNSRRDFGILEAIEFIYDYQDQYSDEVQRELRLFMRQGAKMFAPKEEV